MDALQLLTWSLIPYSFASLASLFLLGLDRLAIKLSGITSLVGGVIGIISGITQLHAGVTLVARFATPFDFADLTREWIASRHLWCWLSPCWLWFVRSIHSLICANTRQAWCDGLLYEYFHRIDGCPGRDGQRFLVHRAV